MRFFEILERLGIKYVPYRPGPGDPKNLVEGAALLFTEFLPFLAKRGNLKLWTLLYLGTFSNAGYALNFTGDKEDEEIFADKETDLVLNPIFYEIANSTPTATHHFNTSVILDQNVVNQLNQQMEELGNNFQTNQTISAAMDYLTAIKVAQDYFLKQKELLIDKKRQESIDYQSVEKNLAAISQEITVVRHFIDSTTKINELDLSLNKFVKKIIEDLSEQKQIVDQENIEYILKIRLKRILDNLFLRAIKIDSKQEIALRDFILAKINNSLKNATTITDDDVKQAFDEIEKQFLKPTIDVKQIYWPDDLVITPDGIILEFPDSRMEHYLSESYTYNGKDINIKLLFLHREEILEQQVLEKVSHYLQSQEDQLEAWISVQHRNAFGKNVQQGAIVSFDDFNKNLSNRLIGDVKLNYAAEADTKTVRNFIKEGSGKEGHNREVTRQAIALIKQRITKAIKNPENFLSKVKQEVRKSKIEMDANERQQIISQINNFATENFSKTYLRYVANIPGFVLAILPQDFDLIKIGFGPRMGTANFGDNIIFLSGYKQINANFPIPFNFPKHALPSVYGGIHYDRSLFRAGNYHLRFESANIHASLEQIALQEVYDMVHSKVSNGHDLDKLFGDHRSVKELKTAIIKSQIYMLQLKILAEKVFSGKSPEAKIVSPLSQDLLQANNLKYSEVKSYLNKIIFNEKEMWEKLLACFEHDFSRLKTEPRYIYIYTLPDKNMAVGKIVPIMDPLQKISVSAKAVEITVKENKAYVKLELPQIKDPNKLYAYILKELTENMLTSVLDTDNADYAYDKAFETIGRIAAVYNKYKSSAKIALKYLQPSLEILNHIVENALQKQFFSNINHYLTELAPEEINAPQQLRL